jgi:hypothetical protein
LKLLANALPKTVRPEIWTMVANPQGYGKSSLVKEFGSQYHNGPVLFTDFSEVTEPEDVQTLLHQTIAPLFCDPYLFTVYAGEFLYFTLFTIQNALTLIPLPTSR